MKPLVLQSLLIIVLCAIRLMDVIILHTGQVTNASSAIDNPFLELICRIHRAMMGNGFAVNVYAIFLT